jgi:hypothetical protein
MTTTPRTENTSDSSPGQVDRRDQLLRVYDQLDDAGKQELLRLTEKLSGLARRANSNCLGQIARARMLAGEILRCFAHDGYGKPPIRNCSKACAASGCLTKG